MKLFTKNYLVQACMVAFVAVMARFVYNVHHTLLTPVTEPYDAHGAAQMSEANILKHTYELADRIGYRILGTIEQEIARDYVLNEIHALQKQLQESEYANLHEMEVFVEEGDGAHRFDFMNKVVIKKYHKLRNLVVRLSDGTDESKENAILINAHIDSTLPSPGATDDAMAVGILLEALRVLSQQPQRLAHSIVFLFNDAEESLQDASHLFITTSPLRKTIKGVVNLEACGTSGPEILFQATNEEMIKAYSHVPRPFGSVLADDVFRTGLILSDTDFRQFVQYGNLTGLDMAVVGNSYLYHTTLDTTANIKPGTAQQFGANILAILRYLSSADADLDNNGSGRMVYFSLLNRFFFMYPVSIGRVINSIVGFLGIVLSIRNPSFGFFKALFVFLLSLGSMFFFNNLWAFFVSNVLDSSMSWFTNEMYPLVIYFSLSTAVLFFIGALFHISDYLMFKAVVFCFSLAPFIPLASSYLFMSLAIWMVLGLLLNDFVFSRPGRLHPVTYFISNIGTFTFGIEAIYGMLDIFVPLTGRIGTAKVADNIIATLCSLGYTVVFPLLTAWIQRFHSIGALKRGFFTSVLVFLSLSIYLLRQPTYYDALHPRRVFVQHMENITSGEFSLHIATADTAPGFEKLVDDISNEFSAVPAVANNVDDWNSDWDTIYPFSQFLDAYRVPLKDTVSVDLLPTITLDEAIEDGDLMNVTVTVHHPGLLWTVLSFDAELISWSLPDVPVGTRRHHIREVSTYGTDSYTFSMSYRKAPIYMDFVGMDGFAHYPSKINEGGNRTSIQICDKLYKDILPEWTDLLCYGIVAGVYIIDA
ncbi:peptidase [Schizosaccharomyces japonicus yFS275]|uniref:Peptide hydrolase n=1 Tax=Schizosaccharomyces japonicus (strain yFS275 / FY16936) TaxID=402676 RepID=B6K5X8_SCHJY|nr:peptidase [Schizosaccharomyces japonicus yFS275]EEB08932.1 peptidase [Schizosaccharomyces japonicus yFS275]